MQTLTCMYELQTLLKLFLSLPPLCSGMSVVEELEGSWLLNGQIKMDAMWTVILSIAVSVILCPLLFRIEGKYNLNP